MIEKEAKEERMEDDDELLPRAFAVTGELPPEAGPPTTGEDYLRRVR